MKTAKIAEIFESFQGEGIYLGAKQVFVRFFGCNLSCSFCDTPLKHFKEYSIDELKGEVLKFTDYHSLCLTGGEPLCQADFLRDFLEGIRDANIKVYLETNGTLVDELTTVLDRIDIISMDFKLPSSCLCGTFWSQHEEFLKACLNKEVFIKMVIAHKTTDEDIFVARDIIKRIRPDVTLVLQPDWFDMDSLLLDKMSSFKKEFTESEIRDVRILPQAHKYAGIK